MRLYILRHGIAEDATAGMTDADRALTQEGRRKLRGVLDRARKARVQPSVILTSPLRRALETAELAEKILNVESGLARTNALVPPSSPERVWQEIRARNVEDILIAGHEPLLSTLMAFLLGCHALRVRMKKGALVCLDVEGTTEPQGVLNWMLIPKLAAE